MNQTLVPTANTNPQVNTTDPTTITMTQRGLEPFLTAKLAEYGRDIAELQGAVDQAKKNKWAHSTLKRHLNKAQAGRSYYEKILAAIKEGYHIIPNFDPDNIKLFAVRKSRPKSIWVDFGSSKSDFPDESHDQLPIGTGNYCGPLPISVGSYYDEDGEKCSKHKKDAIQSYEPTGELGSVEFPLMLAKPNIMEFTAGAMERKIFDAIGITPASKKRTTSRASNPDPVVMGIIEDRSRNRRVCFFLAWHLDARSL